MAPLTLETHADVVESWASIQDASVCTIAVGLLVNCLNHGDTFPLRNVEQLLHNDYLHPRRVLNDILFQHKPVTRHSVSNDQIVRLICVVIALDTPSVTGGHLGRCHSNSNCYQVEDQLLSRHDWVLQMARTDFKPRPYHTSAADCYDMKRFLRRLNISTNGLISSLITTCL